MCAVGHEWGYNLLFFMWRFYSLNIDNILICICKTELVFITKWELVYKCSETFYSFRAGSYNVYTETILIRPF
jgi:hypothetical protein